MVEKSVLEKSKIEDDQRPWSKKLKFEFNCGSSQKTCLAAYIKWPGEFYISSLSGIPADCPSGKILLRAAEKVGKQIGADRVTLADGSIFPIFKKYRLRSTMLKTMLSDAEPTELRSYYSDPGYIFNGEDSAKIQGYVRKVWNLNKDQLLENLAENESAESVRKAMGKYDLAPQANVGVLFRRLYYSQSEEMHADCGILIDHIYGLDYLTVPEEYYSIKKGGLMEAIEAINSVLSMQKDI